MKGWSIICLGLCALAVPPACSALETAASVSAELRQLSVDPAQTYRVRDLQIARGDIKIYLTEGILAFAKPVTGKTIAVMFTTANTEAGDAEVIVMPPARSERASLASFAKSPNLDEHFDSAIFYFSDDTAQELLAQIADRPLHPAPEEAKELAEKYDSVFRSGAEQLDVKLAQSLLDGHSPQRGFFYGIVGGRNLGVFDVMFEPDRFEPVVVGRISTADDGSQFFQIWCSFRPRRKVAPGPPARSISDYRIDAAINPDLTMQSKAAFQYHAGGADGRAIALELSSRLQVTEARVDGKPAEVFQHAMEAGKRVQGTIPVLLVTREALALDKPHEVEVSYQGSVVRRTVSGNYLVDERNTWYPFASPMLTVFDLTLRCPESLRLVSTGELISDEVKAGVRTVHRKTQIPEPLAGFNLGNYESTNLEHHAYRIELFTNKLENSVALPAQAANILDYYTKRWQPLPIHTLAISPIEGYFGQGFPGLIYLSSISYLKEEDRPEQLRNPQLNTFFSEMLLPHEIAHQWWGSMVSQADYRSAWLFEAMSNYSALQYLEQSKGKAALDAVLQRYRDDLLTLEKGKTMESAGPVDFGERLLDNSGMRSWHVIVYEKGVWILHMLRMRMGDEAFHELQKRMLDQFQSKLIANEDFRKLASALLPDDQQDKALSLFFDNWVYSTGIPAIKFRNTGLSMSVKVSGVDDAFTFDLPLRCADASGKERVEWLHTGAGDNTYELPANSRACQLPVQTDFLYQAAN